jgi:hypothetical protein
VVHSVGKAGRGLVQLQILRGTQKRYAVIRDLGDDFGILSCNRLDSGTVVTI